MRIERIQAALVVLGRLLVGCVLVLAYVYSNDRPCLFSRQVPDENINPHTIQSISIDDCFSSRQAKEARARIAGLGKRRDAAELEEAEAEAGQGIDVLGVLVEARGEAERIGKLQPHRADGARGRFFA